MRKFLLNLLLTIIASTAAFGQTKRERDSWMKEMQEYKIDFIAKELALKDDEKANFAKVYNAMDQELRTVQDETFRLEKDVKTKGDKATNLEIEKATEAQFELRGKEAAIEMKYYPKLKAVLSPAQLFKLKDTERKFMRHLMKQHRDHKKK